MSFRTITPEDLAALDKSGYKYWLDTRFAEYLAPYALETTFLNASNYGATVAVLNAGTINASTDSGPCIQAAINAAIAAGFKGIYIPAGMYHVNTPIEVNRQKDFKVYGAGMNRTILVAGQNFWNTNTVWAAGQSVAIGATRTYGGKIYVATSAGTTGATPLAGTTTCSDGTVSWSYSSTFTPGDILTLRNCIRCVVAGMSIYGRTSITAGNPTLAQLNSDNTIIPKSAIACLFDYGTGASGATPYVYTPSSNFFIDLQVGCGLYDTGLPNGLFYGFRFEHVDSHDFGNSEMMNHVVQVANCYKGAYYINGTQAKAHVFYQCLFENTNSVGVYCQQGAFQWYGGSNSATYRAGTFTAPVYSGFAYLLNAPNDPVIIDGCSSEGSGRFLATLAGETTSGYPINIRGCRIDASAVNTTDDIIIMTPYLGPLIIEGNLFDGGQTGHAPRFKFNSASGTGQIRFRNNVISNATNPFVDTTSSDGRYSHIDDRMNVYYDPGGSSTLRTESADVTISEAATTSAITFEVPTYDALFGVELTVVAANGAAGSTRAYVTGRSTTGFTINLEVAPGAGKATTVHWRYTRG